MCDSTSGRGLCDLWCVSVRFFAFTDWRADKQCRCSLELLVSRTFELSRTCTLCGLRPESVCLERLQALPWSYLLLARPMVTCTCNIRLHLHVVARCCNKNIYFFTAPFSGSLVCVIVRKTCQERARTRSKGQTAQRASASYFVNT